MTNDCIHHEFRTTIIAFSPGGHFSELLACLEGIQFHDCHIVTFKSGMSDFSEYPFGTVNSINYLTHPRRRLYHTLKLIFESIQLVLKVRPTIYITSGADIAVPGLLLSKLLLRAITIFIETAGDLKPSFSGLISYPFSDLFLIPYASKKKIFPKSVLMSYPPF